MAPCPGLQFDLHTKAILQSHRHALLLDRLVNVACCDDTFFSLPHVRSLCMVMLDHSGWVPYFGVCPRLHANFGSRLKFFHVPACMTVVIFPLILFGLFEVPGDFLLVVPCWLKQAFHFSTTHQPLCWRQANVWQWCCSIIQQSQVLVITFFFTTS